MARPIASLVLLAVVLAGCGGGADRTAAPVDRSRALDAELQRTTESAGLQGAASVLVVDGHVVWSGATGMADVEAGRPMTPTTPVYFASVSKTITAAVALGAGVAGPAHGHAARAAAAHERRP